MALASPADDAFLKLLEQLSVTVCNNKSPQQAVKAGQTFYSALRSGASQPQARQVLVGKDPEVSYGTLYKTAAAANLASCPETLP